MRLFIIHRRGFLQGSVILCWIFGLVLGSLFILRADDTYFLLMHGALASPVSIVGLATSVYVPLLIAAFMIRISKPELLFVLCFLKGFLSSCCCLAVGQLYGNAGWLIHFLFPFSDSLSAFFLLWLCLRHICYQGHSIWNDLFRLSFAIGILGLLDICWISPFLVKIINR